MQLKIINNDTVQLKIIDNEDTVQLKIIDNEDTVQLKYFIYRRPTLYPVEIAVDFLKSL